jgi:zinc protease
MKKPILLFALLVQCAALFAQKPAPKKYPDINIPYKRFELKNGLKLLVHEDHKAPIAAFNIWYHVGSKNEKPGKTGFAHLFEHLMFNGSEHYNDDYFKVMESIGATNLNGTTNNDRTNYFENFPTSALDKVLWLESDRMGFMVGVIDSARLNEQRGVVQNEKRSGDNQPYSIAEELTTKSTYPSHHPYSWTVIGSLADLDAASIPDVKEWFKKYYGPNNAVIVIAGDVNADSIYAKVNKYFGDIPPAGPISKQSLWTAKMTGTHEEAAQDRVPQARLQKTWNVPAFGTKDATYLNLLKSILAEGKTSRLYKKLVYDDQTASNVYAYLDDREISSQFVIIVNAKPGITLDSLDHTINRELSKVFATGVTAAELERAKTTYFSDFIKGMETIGGFGGKSDILAQYETYNSSADHYKTVQKWIKDATPADIRAIAVTWLMDGEYKLKITPFGTPSAEAPSGINRAVQPPLGAPVAVKFPAVKEFMLSNGLKVAMVKRNAVPVVEMSMFVNAGYAADQNVLPGTASMTMKMLKEGTKKRTSLQISDQSSDLGASIYTYSNLDYNFVGMSVLKTNLDAALDLYSDIIENPVFPQSDFDRIKKQHLLGIKREQVQPSTMGLRILPKLLYGASHAYSNPYTGTGTEASIAKLTRADVAKFYDTWFAPNNATLVVVGDVDETTLKAALESKLALWKKKTVPAKTIATVPMPQKQTVYIVDKPDADQSIIFAAELAPSATDVNNKFYSMANRILGGDFTSRINMNLREDKHWSYGSSSFILDAYGQGFFSTYAAVQTDKTKESVVELQKELKEIISKKPVTETEFKKVQTNSVMELPGIWETNSSVLGDLQSTLMYNRGIDYLNNYAAMLQTFTLDDIQKGAKTVVKPDNLTWVIVGDRAKIEKGIRDLKIGDVQIIDSEGNIVK